MHLIFTCRTCRTCGKNVDKQRFIVVRGRKDENGKPIKVKKRFDRTADGRAGVKEHILGELIDSLLVRMVSLMGTDAYRVIQSHCPTFQMKL